MTKRSAISLVLVAVMLLCPSAALAKSPEGRIVRGHVIDLTSIPTPPSHTYDYSEPIDNPGEVVTRELFCEKYSAPKLIAVNDSETATRSTRLVYGQRILETTIPGSAVYWGEWNGLYQALSSTVIHVVSLGITQPVYSYLFSVFTGFSPQATSQVGIEIGYSYNTYMRQAQVQSYPGGPWETYYTAYKYDYFRYDRTTVQNPAGINPPLLQYVANPQGVYRQAPSPNFYNYGEISTRASMLFQNYCPAGWEDETTVYYPLNMG